jgi:hypothetical protein
MMYVYFFPCWKYELSFIVFCAQLRFSYILKNRLKSVLYSYSTLYVYIYIYIHTESVCIYNLDYGILPSVFIR